MSNTKKAKRANGEGSVYEITISGKKVIEAQLTRIIYIEGEKKVKKIKKRGFKTKTMARQWLIDNTFLLDDWEAEQRGHIAPSELKKPLEMSFDDVWKEYDKYHVSNLTPKVQKQIRHYRGSFDPLNKMLWNEIPVSKFQDCINAAGDTHDVQKKAKNVISGMATYAIKQGWSKENIPRYCSIVKEEVAYKEVFEPNEVRVLWAFYNGEITLSLKSHGGGNYLNEEGYRRAAAALLFMLHSGVRPGELLNVKPEFVDVEKRKIYRAGIKTNKGKSGAILFTSNVKPIVIKYLSVKNEFAQYTMEALRNACNKLFNMLGIKRHVLSSCRTSVATILDSAGIGEEEIKTIMRHANINITRKYYDKSNDDRALEALNTIDDIMNETPEDRIEKYRKQIKELEDKIRLEEEMAAKDNVTLPLPSAS